MDGEDPWGAIGQLTFYWDHHLWPRLEGLTDDEYRWAPAPGRVWDLQPGPDGDCVYADPAPDATVVPTIAWRLMYLAVGCFHTRASTFFGDGSVPDDADMFDPRHRPATVPATAAEALEFLETGYRWWQDGLRSLTAEQMATPLGAKGSVFADAPMSGLALHLNRETMHHGGEIGLLRDLYAASVAS